MHLLIVISEYLIVGSMFSAVKNNRHGPEAFLYDLAAEMRGYTITSASARSSCLSAWGV